MRLGPLAGLVQEGLTWRRHDVCWSHVILRRQEGQPSSRALFDVAVSKSPRQFGAWER